VNSPNSYRSIQVTLGNTLNNKDSEFRRRQLERALVSVIDDDESVRESLPDLLKEFGFEEGRKHFV
jgi:hypothetical protein